MPAFETIARSWIQTLTQTKALAQQGPPAKRLIGKYHVGLPSAQPYGEWDRIAPQATVGVPLDQVGKMLGAFDPASGIYRLQLATQIGQRAPSEAAKIMQELFERYPPSTDAAGSAGVKSLLTMLVNHLLCGGDAEISKQVYIKNRPANVMFKTKLSTVRQNLVAGHEFASTVLNDAAGRTFLKTKLLERTHRNATDPVFIASATSRATQVTVGTWIDEVLTGADDKVLDEMRNPWSQEITPDDPNEMVIELRQLGSFMPHADTRLDKDTGLLAWLKKVYGAHQLYKQRKVQGKRAPLTRR
jgi:hypothetical protein